jgi:type I restriction enzyme S subunit
MSPSYRLDEYATVINGGAWSESEYSNEGIKVVKVTNMSNDTIEGGELSYLPKSLYGYYKAHELFTGDLVLATVGSHPDQPSSVVGKTATIPAEFNGAFLNQNAACIRVIDKDKVSSKYLKYICKTNLFKHHVESRARGSANQVRLAIGELKKFTCDFPSLEIQKKVADILGSYDDLIQINERRISIIEKNLENLYREWFVRFRFPGHTNKKLNDKAPDGWEIRKLGELLRFDKGKTPAALKLHIEDGYDLYLNVEAFEGGSMQYAPLRKAVKCNHDETLMIMDGSRSSFVFNGLSGIVGSTMSVVRTSELYRGIIHQYFKASLDAMVFNNTGSAVPHANKEFIIRMSINLPKNPELINQFNNYWQTCHNKIKCLRDMNRALGYSKLLLLNRLINGQIKVDSFDIIRLASIGEDSGDA